MLPNVYLMAAAVLAGAASSAYVVTVVDRPAPVVVSHVVRVVDSKRHVLVYQFDAARRIGERPTTGWRCLEVDRLEDVGLHEGEWHTAPNVFNPQSCLDQIEVVVSPFQQRRQPAAR